MEDLPMIGEPKELIVLRAREAVTQLRDAAREGREIGFRQRDPLVMAIHKALDLVEIGEPKERA